jgi:hypothetical protein
MPSVASAIPTGLYTNQRFLYFIAKRIPGSVCMPTHPISRLRS